MSRAHLTTRTAELADAPFLARLWVDLCRRADHCDQVSDVEVLVKIAEESPEQRLIVAELDGEPAGAVLVKLSTLTPVNPEPCVLALSLMVLPVARRHGIGRTLVEGAVTFGEELGVGHLVTAVDSGSRDANRFLARLGLGPKATLRFAPLAVVQSKVAGSIPGRAPTGRQLGQILAARRSMRRVDLVPPS